MGLLDKLRDSLALPAVAAGSVAVPYESAWASPNHLLPIDPAPREDIRVSRATAMGVPALARARRLIVGSIARCPLQATVNGETLDNQPAWLSRTDGPVSPFHRMVWTIDDLIFHGWSLWALSRDEHGNVTAADRVPFPDWEFTPAGGVAYLSRPVDADSICLIPGIDEGLIATAPDTIRQAVNLSRAADKAAKTPMAHTELHQTGGEPLSPEGVRDLIAAWTSARRSPDGAVSYTSENIEVKTHGAYDSTLLVEGRNASSVDIARVTGIPSILLDASSADNTMRYSNVDARNWEFIDFCLAPLMGAVAARLGMDDMVPPGMAVEFDVSELTAMRDLDDVTTPDDRSIQP